MARIGPTVAHPARDCDFAGDDAPPRRGAGALARCGASATVGACASARSIAPSSRPPRSSWPPRARTIARRSSPTRSCSAPPRRGPRARGRGIGGALLEACAAAARAAGERRLRTLDQPGNYLAPGVDERNIATIAWLERRGFRRAAAEPRVNVLIDVRDNPRVSAARAGELAARAAAAGYEVRRARPDEGALVAAVAAEFGGAWPFEVERALGHAPAGVHVALRDGAYCAFAAHDGNNRGLGWFGPTGTWPAHRGRGLGEALLLACLVDVAAAHARCEVAWIGPRPFYEKAAGVAAERRFIVLAREL